MDKRARLQKGNGSMWSDSQVPIRLGKEPIFSSHNDVNHLEGGKNNEKNNNTHIHKPNQPTKQQQQNRRRQLYPISQFKHWFNIAWDRCRNQSCQTLAVGSNL